VLQGCGRVSSPIGTLRVHRISAAAHTKHTAASTIAPPAAVKIKLPRPPSSCGCIPQDEFRRVVCRGRPAVEPWATRPSSVVVRAGQLSRPRALRKLSLSVSIGRQQLQSAGSSAMPPQGHAAEHPLPCRQYSHAAGRHARALCAAAACK
jgi:hypothetical protein